MGGERGEGEGEGGRGGRGREGGGVRVGGGLLFKAGRLLTFPTFSMGAYSRWALIRDWAVNQINTVLGLLTHLSNNIIFCCNFYHNFN